jgi:glycine/D-amino acid oxidase-like deaminating enzyme/CRP-like cAMP-binding protein
MDTSETERKTLALRDVRRIARDMLERWGAAGGRSLPEPLAAELQRLDRDCDFSDSALAEFQGLLARVGLATHRPIMVPVNDEPFWFRAGHPLAGYRSRTELPAMADVVIIGAGLTGAAAAYHLTDAARAGTSVVVLDRGDPAGEASGRNGGNFELIPENSVGIYEGLARERLAFLQRCYSSLPREVLGAESERQASLVLGLALRNRELLKSIVMRERIDCDLMPRGWLHLASSEEEEQGLCDEVLLAAQHGQQIQLWSRGRIRREFGVDTPFLGRFIPGDGTYHPFKYVCGLLRCALDRGVQLYTRVDVRSVESDAGNIHRVVTDQGTLMAGRVIVATNAFTSTLFPELSAIRPRQSQIQVTEHAPDRARGRVVTSDEGPVFFNQPRAGARGGRAPVLMGGGADRAMHSPSSRRRSTAVHETLLAQRDRFFPELEGQPPSAEWIGPMAFTPDQLPAIGMLRPGVIVAAGFNGYGGSYTTAAGCAAAQMATTGRAPDWVPADMFSPVRLMTRAASFVANTEGLWRVAQALCRQLTAVNARISEALRLSGVPVESAVRGQRPPRVSRMITVAGLDLSPVTSIAARELATFEVFQQFSPSELDALAEKMTRLEIHDDTLLFAAGDPGGSCFVILSGAVDVSVKVHGAPQLLAQLGESDVFGQVSLLLDAPRSASCSVRRGAVLAELDRDACKALLDAGTPLARKLLDALTRGVVEALRAADRRLMRLEREGETAGNRMLSGSLELQT